MKRWEEQITINAPADKIFAYVSDFERHGEWSGHGLKATKTSEGPIAVGTTYSTEASQFGTQHEKSTVTEVTPPSTFGWESVGGLGKVRHWFTITDNGGTTSVSKGAEFVEAKFLAKMLGFKLNKDLPGALRSDLASIKKTLEGSA